MPDAAGRPFSNRSSINGIEWIAFDAVGTLLYPDPPVALVYADVGRRYGSRLKPHDVSSRFAQAFAANETGDLRLDETSTDALRTSEDAEFERWRSIVGQVLDDTERPDECFAELFEYFGRPEAWSCFPDVGETLSQLSRRDYRLALASNFDSRLERVWRGRPELQPISQVVISSLVGFRKPSHRFYDALIRATGCRPEQLLMVGDDWANDVDGARRAGLRAIHLKREANRSAGRIASEEIGSLIELADRLAGPVKK